MASLVFRREGSPYWYFNLTVNGQRKRPSTGETEKKRAEQVAAERIRRQRDLEVFGHKPDMTIREALFDHWLPTKEGNRNYTYYKRCCSLFCGDVAGVKGIGGSTKMHTLTTLTLQSYRTQRQRKGLKPRSVDREMSCLQGAHNLVKSGARVASDLEFPFARPEGTNRPLTADEVEALLTKLNPASPLVQKGVPYFLDDLAPLQVQRVDNYHLTIALLDTGCRLGEIMSLRWSDVDTMTFGSILIDRHKVKGRNSKGSLALTSRLATILRERHEKRGTNRYVFPDADPEVNQGKKARNTKAIRKAMADIGINSPENIAVYGRRDVRSLRDTFATILRTQGKMPLDRIQLLLGHSSPKMTDKYAGLALSMPAMEAADILNSIDTTYRETSHD